MDYPSSHFALLSALLAIAAASDVALRRIPNVVVVAVAAAGIASQAVVHGMGNAASGLAAAGITAGVLWPAWKRRMVGGGDLKLAAASAGWIALAGVPVYFVASALAAGMLAVVAYSASTLGARSAMRRNLVALALGSGSADLPLQPVPGRAVVPAGAAFALGALFTILFGGTP
ncbi:prepilin peptidase [Anaeromyxobacter sp. Fw109-5]|uniref:prepilin peptidase n=1 Tax=Anaeromyxobacter sp. (strain Fw109-5) TaxID=404589 RepID=UPI000158A81B|nr:A24 family peptidase [Anaeromyxobacter sp. Fw109-5]ABS28149.1 peptidase A24A prepilin type IV [Anaeromyxobacter sp. Fw109-5]